MKVLFQFIRVIAIILIIVGGFLSYLVVFHHLGILLGLLAVLIFPVTVTVAPWFAAIADQNWLPLLFTYGGIALTVVASVLLRA